MKNNIIRSLNSGETVIKASLMLIIMFLVSFSCSKKKIKSEIITTLLSENELKQITDLDIRILERSIHHYIVQMKNCSENDFGMKSLEIINDSVFDRGYGKLCFVSKMDSVVYKGNVHFSNKQIKLIYKMYEYNINYIQKFSLGNQYFILYSTWLNENYIFSENFENILDIPISNFYTCPKHKYLNIRFDMSIRDFMSEYKWKKVEF